MAWPTSQDYNEAVQAPAANFDDPDLKRAQVATNALGLPMPYSGNFADVYQFVGPDGTRWAVKCFTRERPGLRERYAAISEHLGRARLPFTVDFTYLEQGILVGGQWYPVLKMEWVEGLTLNQFVAKAAAKPATLEALLQLWGRMARRLRDANVAHADLQHGNVLLVPEGGGSLALKLVDYDGMWVPALARGKSGEVGHTSYQHPGRVREETYNREVDRFPLLLIATALRALVTGGPALWEAHDNGDNLLFTDAALQAPTKSPLFRDLLHSADPLVVAMTKQMLDALRGRLESTPLLDAVMPEEPRPAPARPPSPKTPGPPARPSKVVLVAAAHAALPAVEPSAAETRPSAAAVIYAKEEDWGAARRRRVRMLAGAGAVVSCVTVAGLAIALWLSGEGDKQPLRTSSAGGALAHANTSHPASPTSKETSTKKATEKAKQTYIGGGGGPPATNKDTGLRGGSKPDTGKRRPAIGPGPKVTQRFDADPHGGALVQLEDDNTLIIGHRGGKTNCDDIHFGDPTWQDYDFEVGVRRLGDATHCALCFRNGDQSNRWRVALFVDNEPRVVLQKHREGPQWDDKDSRPAAIKDNNWHLLKISVRGTAAECFVDNVSLFKSQVAANPRGGVGLHANGGGFAFCNIRVTAPDGKELLGGLPRVRQAVAEKARDEEEAKKLAEDKAQKEKEEAKKLAEEKAQKEKEEAKKLAEDKARKEAYAAAERQLKQAKRELAEAAEADRDGRGAAARRLREGAYDTLRSLVKSHPDTMVATEAQKLLAE